MPPEATRVAWNQPAAVLNPRVPVGPLPRPRFSLSTVWPDASVIARCHGSGLALARSGPASTCAEACAGIRETPRATASPTASRCPRRAFTSGSAAGDGGEDRHLVAVGDLRVEAVLEADVLAGDVDVDEPAQIPVLGDPLAQAVVLVEDRLERLADGGSLDLQLAPATGGRPDVRRIR